MGESLTSKAAVTWRLLLGHAQVCLRELVSNSFYSTCGGFFHSFLHLLNCLYFDPCIFPFLLFLLLI